MRYLRDLPGIMEIEAICQIRSYFDDKNFWSTMARINDVSVSLFSIPGYRTDYDDFVWDDDEGVRPPTRNEWDGLMEKSLQEFSDTREFWEVIGWDITNGQNRELDCAHFFTRQIIVFESSWIEDISFTPDGSGTFEVETRELSEAELEQRLRREADDFLLGKA